MSYKKYQIEKQSIISIGKKVKWWLKKKLTVIILVGRHWQRIRRKNWKRSKYWREIYTWSRDQVTQKGVGNSNGNGNGSGEGEGESQNQVNTQYWRFVLEHCCGRFARAGRPPPDPWVGVRGLTVGGRRRGGEDSGEGEGGGGGAAWPLLHVWNPTSTQQHIVSLSTAFTRPPLSPLPSPLVAEAGRRPLQIRPAVYTICALASCHFVVLHELASSIINCAFKTVGIDSI